MEKPTSKIEYLAVLRQINLTVEDMAKHLQDLDINGIDSISQGKRQIRSKLCAGKHELERSTVNSEMNL